jgi:hypothetical protein
MDVDYCFFCLWNGNEILLSSSEVYHDTKFSISYQLRKVLIFDEGQRFIRDCDARQLN